MNVEPPWYVLAVLTTWLNGSTLGFIAWRERNGALRFWAAAWLAWGLAVIPLAALGSPHAQPLVAVACGLLWVASTLCFLRGAYALSGRMMSRLWYAVAAGCAVLALALGVGPNGATGMVPLVLFQSVGLTSTGVVIIRGGRGRAGGWLCGAALIGLGLHVLDAPFFASRPGLFVWGFVLAIGLQILAALGMLMLYYEHARAELLQTQHQLEQNRRMEALGRVAGGVAHDFNNMLTVMRGQLDLIQFRGAVPPGAKEALEAIEQATERAARLTSQLLAFGGRSMIQQQSIDVRAVVAATLDMLQKVIPANVRLTLRCTEGSYAASVDQSLLEQIVLNLVTNARDAIAGDGSIQVELARTERPQPALRIRVTDDGAGMEEAVVQRAFEPFFTLKAAGHGTGLGLASVQGAVAQLGGEIHVESQLGRGSTFEVVLPWREPVAAPAPAAHAKPHDTLRVLVVDDDEDVRAITVRMLQDAGHDVEQASDGLGALERIRSKAFDVLVSDLIMPRMGGADLRDEVSKLNPGLAVLLTSGYPSDAMLETDRVGFLPKPFGRAELLHAIERLIRSH